MINKAFVAMVGVLFMSCTADLAMANHVYNVSATLQYGGTLSGTFTTNDANTAVTSYNIVASGGPGSAGFTFPGFDYTSADSTVTAETPTLIQFDSAPSGEELRFVFSSALTTSGATLSTTSYESEITAGNRKVSSGSVTAAVPEPASLTLTGSALVIGVGLAWYRQKRRTARQKLPS